MTYWLGLSQDWDASNNWDPSETPGVLDTAVLSEFYINSNVPVVSSGGFLVQSVYLYAGEETPDWGLHITDGGELGVTDQFWVWDNARLYIHSGGSVYGPEFHIMDLAKVQIAGSMAAQFIQNNGLIELFAGGTLDFDDLSNYGSVIDHRVGVWTVAGDIENYGTINAPSVELVIASGFELSNGDFDAFSEVITVSQLTNRGLVDNDERIVGDVRNEYKFMNYGLIQGNVDNVGELWGPGSIIGNVSQSGINAEFSIGNSSDNGVEVSGNLVVASGSLRVDSSASGEAASIGGTLSLAGNLVIVDLPNMVGGQTLTLVTVGGTTTLGALSVTAYENADFSYFVGMLAGSSDLVLRALNNSQTGGEGILDASGASAPLQFIFNSATGVASVAGGQFANSWQVAMNVDTVVGTSFGDTLDASLVPGTPQAQYRSITLRGGLGNDLISGGLGNDMLFGGGDDDLIAGGEGADAINGGAGIDTVSYANAAAAVVANLASGGSGGDALGDTFINVENMRGSIYNDTLTGDQQNNTLDGLVGADTLRGGAGNDVYIVDQAGDNVWEAAGQGYDVVQSTAAYFSLEAAGEVEELILVGAGNLEAKGNALNNKITGNAFDNIIRGGQGDDVLFGGQGNDQLFGGQGRDTLNAGQGNDLLDGGAGADIMSGGQGDDTYVVDDIGDIINDVAMGGRDLVMAMASVTLGYEIEDLWFGSNAGAVNGTGNELNNVMTGSASDNVLNGLGGNDNLYGSGGNDTIIGGMGADRLEGQDGNDTLQGSRGEDILNGGLGNDLLTGGQDNDFFDFYGQFDSDTITDFAGGTGAGDVIRLQLGAAFDTFGEVKAAMTQNGANTIIDFGGGNTLTVNNMTVAAFAADDFLFV